MSEQVFVAVGTLVGEAIPFKEANVSDTYRGQVLPAEGSTRAAVIKDLPPKELANELMAAALARLVGLPVPEPFLVRATAPDLLASKGPLLDDGSRLVFASMDMKQPNVAALYNGGNVDVVRRRLAQWAEVGRLYGFDALVANIDRHEGNLLLAGNQQVWLIDHGHCFSGPAWVAAELDPATPYHQRLQDWLTPSMKEAERTTAAALATEFPKAYAGCDVEALGAANFVAEVLDEGDFNALVNFVVNRQPLVPQFSANALGLVA